MRNSIPNSSLFNIEHHIISSLYLFHLALLFRNDENLPPTIHHSPFACVHPWIWSSRCRPMQMVTCTKPWKLLGLRPSTPPRQFGSIWTKRKQTCHLSIFPLWISERTWTNHDKMMRYLHWIALVFLGPLVWPCHANGWRIGVEENIYRKNVLHQGLTIHATFRLKAFGQYFPHPGCPFPDFLPPTQIQVPDTCPQVG